MSACGIGCRKGCDVQDIVHAIERALHAAGLGVQDLDCLCAPDFKSEEPALAHVAEHFGKPLLFLPLAQLQAQSSHTLSASEHTSRLFGVPSISETAALAGAAQLGAARLLGPRQNVGDASCALARAITENQT